VVERVTHEGLAIVGLLLHLRPPPSSLAIDLLRRRGRVKGRSLLLNTLPNGILLLYFLCL
jgi:hypothetical protein